MQLAALRVFWAAPIQRAQGILQHAAALLSPSVPSASSTQLAVDVSEAVAPQVQPWRSAGPFRHADGARAGVRTAPAPAPTRATPSASHPAPSPSGAFSVEIAVQGFEKRYVDMACNAIDDMVMLAFAPKSFASLPTGAPDPADAPVALAFGAARRDVKLPWRRTRFTVIRGPHIDKMGMEQFERREYKSVLTAATNSEAELRRLLEGLKIYQFTGVQLRVDVTSAATLALPPDVLALLGSAPRATAAAAGTPPRDLVSEQPPVWPAAAPQLGAPVATIPAPRSPELAFEAELAEVLSLLRPLVRQGQTAVLDALERDPGMRQQCKGWLSKKRVVPADGPVPGSSSSGAGASAAALAASAGGDVYELLLRQRLHQATRAMLEAGGPKRSGYTDPEDAAAPATFGMSPDKVAEVLARIDAELLQARGTQAAAEAPPPATAPPGAGAGASAAAADGPPALDPASMSPAEYVHAVLSYVRHVDELAAAAAPAARHADVELQLNAPGLALRLLQMWVAATSVEFKRYLALPPDWAIAQFVEQRKAALQQQQQQKEAGAGTARARPGSGSGSGSEQGASTQSGTQAAAAAMELFAEAAGSYGPGAGVGAAAGGEAGGRPKAGQGQGQGRIREREREREHGGPQDKSGRGPRRGGGRQ